MIKKLIISAAILTALIAGKEAHAAGAGGFARALSSASAVHVQVAENRFQRHDEVPATVSGPTVDQRQELLRVNAAVNGSIAQLDAFFDDFAGAEADTGLKSCFDCADIKRDHLQALGWSEKAMHIAYAVSPEGHIQRVLVVSIGDSDVVLGDESPLVEVSGPQAPQPVHAIEIKAEPVQFDI
jgi:predicted transglutaminase-like cysteine proteinase